MMVLLLRCMSQHLCRFSDAGNDDLTMRSGDDRGCPAFLLKMAKRSLPFVRLRGFHFVRKNAIV